MVVHCILNILNVFALLIFYLLVYVDYCMVNGIEVTPNASDVVAKVKDKIPIDKTANVTLHVLEANDYQNMPNFVKDKIGKDITITVSIDDLPYFDKDVVNVLISFVGDDRGQMYTAQIKP